jgi:hypothetical protein
MYFDKFSKYMDVLGSSETCGEKNKKNYHDHYYDSGMYPVREAERRTSGRLDGGPGSEGGRQRDTTQTQTRQAGRGSASPVMLAAVDSETDSNVGLGAFSDANRDAQGCDRPTLKS